MDNPTKEAVVRSLLMMAKTMRFAKPEDIDEDVVRVWRAVISAGQVTTAEFKAAVVRLASTTSQFPVPADLLSLVIDMRYEAKLAKARAFLDMGVLCLDERGVFCLARPECVLDGRHVEGGGNGKPYQSAGTDPDALTGPARAALAAILKPEGAPSTTATKGNQP